MAERNHGNYLKDNTEGEGFKLLCGAAERHSGHGGGEAVQTAEGARPQSKTAVGGLHPSPPPAALWDPEQLLQFAVTQLNPLLRGHREVFVTHLAAGC